MQKAELIFNSLWTALMGVLILGGPEHPYKEWTTALGILMFLPSVVTVVALTVTAEWFQGIVKKVRATTPAPAAGQ
jgi:NADH:ubiquinone oxidoreductase subunit H